MKLNLGFTGEDMAKMDKRIINDYEGILSEIVLFKTVMLLKGADNDYLGKIDAATFMQANRLANELGGKEE